MEYHEAWNLGSIPRLEEALESSLKVIHDFSIRKEAVTKRPDLYVLEYHLVEHYPTLESFFSDLIRAHGFRLMRFDRREGPILQISFDPDRDLIYKVHSLGSTNMWNFYVLGNLCISFTVGVYLKGKDGHYHYSIDYGGHPITSVELSSSSGSPDQVFQWRDHPKLNPETGYKLKYLSEYLHEDLIKNGMEFWKMSEYVVSWVYEHLSIYIYPKGEFLDLRFSIHPYLSIIFNLLDLRPYPF